MSLAANSNLLLQAEIDYRHQRAMDAFHPKPRPSRNARHKAWRIAKAGTPTRRRNKPVVD